MFSGAFGEDISISYFIFGNVSLKGVPMNTYSMGIMRKDYTRKRKFFFRCGKKNWKSKIAQKI